MIEKRTNTDGNEKVYTVRHYFCKKCGKYKRIEGH